MEKIYDDYKDKNVRQTILYADLDLDGTDVYVDEEQSTLATAEQVKEAFLKGLVLSRDGKYHFPSYFYVGIMGEVHVKYVIEIEDDIEMAQVIAYPVTEEDEEDEEGGPVQT